MKKLYEVKTREELAELLEVSLSTLTCILYKRGPDSFYRTFEIPKKSGGTREIEAPEDQLKTIQHRLAEILSDPENQRPEHRQEISPAAHGFVKGRGIITNAKEHRNKKFILNLDLKDFFPSIHFRRVEGYFEKNRSFELPHDIAVMIAQLTCYKGRLPQGAPTSPVIANLIAGILDHRMMGIARKYKLDYTRYADDLTFSSNDPHLKENLSSLLAEIEFAVEKSGFHLNPKKTRFIYESSRQEVTGLVVNEQINPTRDFIKETRAMADHLYRDGAFMIDGKEGSLDQLEGRFAFISQIKNSTSSEDEPAESNQQPKEKAAGSTFEKDCRTFQFYRHFYHPERPVIITSSQLDTDLLKEAFKRYWQSYPSLVTKDQNGDNHLKLDILYRPKWLEKHFQIQPGPWALQDIYHQYFGLKGWQGYFYPLESKDAEMGQPVFLLFDNQLNDPDSPVIDLLEKVQGSVSELAGHGILRLLPPKAKDENSNLYLMTVPLPEGKETAALMDLLPEDVQLKIRSEFEKEPNQFGHDDRHDKSRSRKPDLEHADLSAFLPLLDLISSSIEVFRNHQD